MGRSVLLSSLVGASSASGGGGSVADGASRLYLFVGLQNGVLMRSLVDEADGSLGDLRKKFLGTKPVRLFDVHVGLSPAVLAISSRSWLSYTFQASTRAHVHTRATHVHSIHEDRIHQTDRCSCLLSLSVAPFSHDTRTRYLALLTALCCGVTILCALCYAMRYSGVICCAVIRCVVL